MEGNQVDTGQGDPRMIPPLSFTNVTTNASTDYLSSPLPLSPSSPTVPFPSSPVASSPTMNPPLLRTRPAVRSPRTSQGSISSRLSIASNVSTSSSLGPHVLMRSRHSSLPASVVQSRHQSIVGTPQNRSASSGVKALNRISVASVGSFGSVEEEEEEGEGEDKGSKIEGERLSPAPSRTTSFSKQLRPRPRHASRHSLPSLGGGLPSSISSVLNPTGAKDRSSSPLRPGGRKEYSMEERARRDEKRLRIAEELRETEKAYVKVLEEIDENYYQPLLKALPAVDPLARRASNRYSATPASRSTSPNTSPRTSTYSPSASRSRTTTVGSLASSSDSSPNTTDSTAPSTPPTPAPGSNDPVWTRREINEVFSNFTDVLNLSHVMLLTLNEAVPERPSKPLSISPSQQNLRSSTPITKPSEGVGSVESRLSNSGSTFESSGPSTPNEGDLSSSGPPHTSTSRPTSVDLDNRSRRSTPASPLRLGKTLLPILPFLKQYSLFVANFSGSLSRLSQLERSESNGWGEFVKSRKVSQQGGKIGLGGMLLNVVQRVPRYRLLLGELIEYTEEGHPDLGCLRKAFELVDSVASHLDSQIESHTHDLSILNLQRSFSNLDFPLLSPGRRLLKSGPLRKFNRAGKEQTRVFFLFNDLLLHAVETDSGANWGLGITGIGANEIGIDQQAKEYTLLDRFELEDVTVVGSEEGQLKYGFEILSSRKSFAVYSDSLDGKMAWLDAVRDAKAALMSDRRTLQRATIFDPISPPPPHSTTSMKGDRRVSLPSPSKNPTSFLSTPPRSRQTSFAPQLGTIPPTPADEIDQLVFPISTPPLTTPFLDDSPPLAFPSSPTRSRSSSPNSPPLPPAQSDTPPTPIRPPSLARSRRWSELRPSDAVQAITSAFVPSSSPKSLLEDLSTDEVEYKVIEAYNAPVWVPNSKADRCMRCNEVFEIWRRRHHCRLCGGVVCWACSTKYFIIPGFLLSSSSSQSTEDRLARSCDTCYTAIFDDPTPSSRFLGSSTPATFGRSTLQPCVDKTATLHRLSRIVNPRSMPIFDEDTPALGAPSLSVSPRQPNSSPIAVEQKRRRRLTAVGTLQDLLAKQS